MADNKIQLSENIIVTDPCYNIGTWCQIELHDILPGFYNCSFVSEDNGTRVGKIRVVHESVANENIEAKLRLLEDKTVGVDSGMAGIFDMNYYKEHHESDEWYQNVYKKTICKVPNPDYKPLDKRENLTNEYSQFEESVKSLFQKYPINDTFNMLKLTASMLSPYKELAADIIDRLIYLKDNVVISCNTAININTNELQNDAIVVIRTFILSYIRKTDVMDYIISFKEIDASLASEMDGKCFVSAAGYGDGGYNCYVAQNDDGKIIAIEVVFIGDDEDENDID